MNWGQRVFALLTCAKAFHEKAGRSQVGSVFFVGQDFFSRRVTADAILPSALFEERFGFARCKLGVLVYSRCCHLIGDLCFHL